MKHTTAKEALRKLYTLDGNDVGYVVIPVSQFELARSIITHTMGKKCDIQTRTSNSRVLIKIYC